MARFTVEFVFRVMFFSLLVTRDCVGQATSKPDDDAWLLYSKAGERVEEGYRATISSPAASNLSYSDFPPFPPLWYKYEKYSYAYNAPARALMREARSRKVARWPETPADEKLNLRYRSQCRALANEVSDAAMYEHLQGDDAAAIETLQDELHLADLLDGGTAPLSDHLLLAAGIRQIATNRLKVIATMMSFTEDATDYRRVQVRIVRQLIRQLVDPRDPDETFAAVLDREDATWRPIDRDRFLIVLRREQMEQHLTAMSLACHLFRFEKSRWPASLAELLPYLPGEPMDAWGKEGYVLVKLLDGGDQTHTSPRCGSVTSPIALYAGMAETAIRWPALPDAGRTETVSGSSELHSAVTA